VLVMAVAAAASVTSLRNGFVYDDGPAVAQDTRIRSLAHPDRLLRLPYWNDQVRDRIYRPATTLSFATDWVAGGGRAWVFHLTNILLHVAVCFLVYLLACGVLGAGPGALAGALWFAVHPVHVEVVANVVGRSELLAALGYLAAVLAYAAEGRAAALAPAGWRRAALAAAALAGAALAYAGKEHALTLPALLVLADLWVAKRDGARAAETFRRHAITWAGTVALALGYLAARHAVLGTTFGGGSVGAGLDDLTVAGRALVMTPAMLVWFRLLAVPVALSADYSPAHFVPSTSFGLTHALGAALVLGVGFTAWRWRGRVPALAAGALWFALTAAIAANVVFPTGVMLAERVLYLPSAGAALVAGALAAGLPARARWPLVTVVVVLLAARSMARIPAWRDEQTFYAALVHDAPESYRSHWATGARAFEAHRAREGEAEYLVAVRTWPGDAALLQELGERYLAAGAWRPADRFLTLAFREDSLRADAAVQAVLARLRLGLPDSAAALGLRALRTHPRAPTLLLATGDAFFALGRPMRALTLRRRMVFAFPRTWQFQFAAAEGAARAGRCEEARLRAGRARALAPSEDAPRALSARLGDGPTCAAGW
jgi:hypothetical protein